MFCGDTWNKAHVHMYRKSILIKRYLTKIKPTNWNTMPRQCDKHKTIQIKYKTFKCFDSFCVAFLSMRVALLKMYENTSLLSWETR